MSDTIMLQEDYFHCEVASALEESGIPVANHQKVNPAINNNHVRFDAVGMYSAFRFGITP